jgi:hypothetical protein
MTEILYQLPKLHIRPFGFQCVFRSLRLIPKKTHILLSFCLSTFQSACISAASNGKISVKFDIGDFLKICQKMKICLNANKNIGHLTWRPTGLSSLAATHIRYKSIFVRDSVLLYCRQWHVPHQTNIENIVALPQQKWFPERAQLKLWIQPNVLAVIWPIWLRSITFLSD